MLIQISCQANRVFRRYPFAKEFFCPKPKRLLSSRITLWNQASSNVLDDLKFTIQARLNLNYFTRLMMSDSNQQAGIRAKNDLSDMRKPYRDQDDGIEESQLPSKDPMKLFEVWFNMVKESGTVYEPNAFCISTCGKDNQPSSRMVLLKGFDDQGFRFFTHYSSQKGRNIAENPKVSMLFYWDCYNRQVRIEGAAERLSQESAEEYFKRRPQSSQIGAAISDQSSLVESREALMKRYDDLKAELGDQMPKKPSTWGGYLIRPERFEFWQGNTNRVHDRIMFRRAREGEQPDGKLSRLAENGWIIERMLP